MKMVTIEKPDGTYVVPKGFVWLWWLAYQTFGRFERAVERWASIKDDNP